MGASADGGKSSSIACFASKLVSCTRLEGFRQQGLKDRNQRAENPVNAHGGRQGEAHDENEDHHDDGESLHRLVGIHALASGSRKGLVSEVFCPPGSEKKGSGGGQDVGDGHEEEDHDAGDGSRGSGEVGEALGNRRCQCQAHEGTAGQGGTSLQGGPNADKDRELDDEKKQRQEGVHLRLAHQRRLLHRKGLFLFLVCRGVGVFGLESIQHRLNFLLLCLSLALQEGGEDGDDTGNQRDDENRQELGGSRFAKAVGNDVNEIGKRIDEETFQETIVPERFSPTFTGDVDCCAVLFENAIAR